MAIPPTYDNTKSLPEYYTPPRYIRLVKQVLGNIDLDPASCTFANETVGAARYYTLQENGLLLPWHGKVFLNPPYGKVDNISEQQRWSGRLIAEYEKGNVQEAILLCNSSDTSTLWYQRLMPYPHCLTNHRIMFYRYHTHEKQRAMCGSIFSYFGSNVERFYEVFSEIGICLAPAVRYPQKLTLFDV